MEKPKQIFIKFLVSTNKISKDWAMVIITLLLKKCSRDLLRKRISIHLASQGIEVFHEIK